METDDLILRKAQFEDWESMYRNVWSRPETARYMAWRVSVCEEDARGRMERTIQYQKDHDTYGVYEKSRGEAIGFAGMEEISPKIYRDTGIALGPEYVGRGYGKQVLQMLLRHGKRLGGEMFYVSVRAENKAAKGLAASCGFVYQYSEERTDPRDGGRYELEVYKKEL